MRSVLVLLGYKQRHGLYENRKLDTTVATLWRRTRVQDRANEDHFMAWCADFRVDGMAPLRPTDQCAATAKHGTESRIARALPNHDRRLRREFCKYSEKWLTENIPPIQSDMVNWDDWLAWVSSRGTYTEIEIEAIRTYAIENPNRLLVSVKSVRYMKVGIFIKQEFYVDFKPTRNIFAVDLTTKLHYSAIVYLFEKHLVDHFGYHNSEAVQCGRAWTMKKVPVSERGRMMIELGLGNTFVTDMSSAERHHIRYVMKLFIHAMRTAFKGCSWAEPILAEFNEYLQTPKKCQMTFWKFLLDVVLLSGHPMTSIANALFNLLIIVFTKFKHPLMIIKWFAVEGDDGVGVFSGPAPSPKFFTDLGLLLKYEVTETHKASFCGMMFDPISGDTIGDIFKHMSKLPWLFKPFGRHSSRLRMVRARALSLYYQFPNCPVLSQYLYGILQRTSGYNIGGVLKHFDKYKREQILEALVAKFHQVPPRVKDTTREIVSEIFGIDVEQQIMIEGTIVDALLRNEVVLQLPALLFACPSPYVVSWCKYVQLISNSQVTWTHM